LVASFAGSTIETPAPRRGGRIFALRFHAYGERRYLTLGTAEQGWTKRKAKDELANVLADVRQGIWKPPRSEDDLKGPPTPTFYEFASEWLATRRHEFAALRAKLGKHPAITTAQMGHVIRA
jgi:hypothetical protein